MSHPLEAIPVLTDIVEDAPNAAAPIDRTLLFLGDLELRLTTAVHDHADELVHNACRELEALLLEQVSDRLRAELPALVVRIVDEHFHGSGRVD